MAASGDALDCAGYANGDEKQEFVRSGSVQAGAKASQALE